MKDPYKLFLAGVLSEDNYHNFLENKEIKESTEDIKPFVIDKSEGPVTASIAINRIFKLLRAGKINVEDATKLTVSLNLINNKILL